MKFIIPQNYNFNKKILGIIDYQSAILDVIWCVLVFITINIFDININLKIVLFMMLAFPVIIFSISGFNGENIVNVIIYICKFIIRQKVLFYEKKQYYN